MSTYEYDLECNSMKSSFLDKVYYDEEKNLLFVDIGDSTYGYYGVEKHIYNELIGHESPGRYYNAIIRGFAFIKDANIGLKPRSEGTHNFVVTIQATYDVAIKADSFEEAIEKAKKGAPEGVVVKEVRLTFE